MSIPAYEVSRLQIHSLVVASKFKKIWGWNSSCGAADQQGHSWALQWMCHIVHSELDSVRSQSCSGSCQLWVPTSFGVSPAWRYISVVTANKHFFLFGNMLKIYVCVCVPCMHTFVSTLAIERKPFYGKYPTLHIISLANAKMSVNIV